MGSRGTGCSSRRPKERTPSLVPGTRRPPFLLSRVGSQVGSRMFPGGRGGEWGMLVPQLLLGHTKPSARRAGGVFQRGQQVRPHHEQDNERGVSRRGYKAVGWVAGEYSCTESTRYASSKRVLTRTFDSERVHSRRREPQGSSQRLPCRRGAVYVQ